MLQLLFTEEVELAVLKKNLVVVFLPNGRPFSYELSGSIEAGLYAS
jgi:hypothetical protein